MIASYTYYRLEEQLSYVLQFSDARDDSSDTRDDTLFALSQNVALRDFPFLNS